MRQIIVFNDREMVFEGNLQDFLQINEHDTWLVDLTKDLKEKGDKIEITDNHIGEWIIECIG